MFLLIAIAVVIAFVLIIGITVLISIGRAASIDHNPTIALAYDRKTPAARGRHHAM